MSRPGRKSASQTPAPKSDKIYGSKKNAPGSASSKKSAKSINLSKSIIKSLEDKLTEFRKNHDKNITINDLKAVYRRGLGAYSSTHRPTITGGVPNTRNAWAMARVNKFLKKAGGQKVKAAYVQDDDLMKQGGEIFKKGGKTKEAKGDCYVAAGDIVMNYLMKDRGFGKYVFGESEFNFHGTPYLVHAEVSGQAHLEGVRYGHAWVEDDVLVYDYSNGRKIVFPKKLYYAIGEVNTENPKKYQKYTFEEAKNKMIETGNYGCWDLDVEFEKGGEVFKDYKEGECFKNVQEYLLMNELPNAVIVHGEVNTSRGKINHAWILDGDKVIDPTTGVEVDKEIYYNKLNPSEDSVYTFTEALKLRFNTKNFGPWTEEEQSKFLGKREEFADGGQFKKAYTGGYLERIWELFDEKYGIGDEDSFETKLPIGNIHIEKKRFQDGTLKSYSIYVTDKDSVILNTDKVSKLTKKQEIILQKIINSLKDDGYLMVLNPDANNPDIRFKDGGITKNTVIDTILKETAPIQEEITQQWYDEVTKKGIRITEAQIELFKYNIVVDLVKAVGNYIEQDDSIKNIHIDKSRQGLITLSCIIERGGNEYGFSTDVIYAGGHSIQKLHLRYIVKTRLPHKSSNTYYDKLNEELKRRTKVEKLKEELGWAENRLRINKENLEKAIENSKLSDEEVERISREEKPEEWKYYKETTWEEIVKRGADKNYDYSEEEFNKSMIEAKKSLIDFWRYRNANIKQKEASIKTEEKEIEKLNKKISELQPKMADGGELFDGSEQGGETDEILSNLEVDKLINDGIVQLEMYDTSNEHSKIYGLDAQKPLFIKSIIVSKEYRGKGIGNKVMNHIVEHANKNGNDVIFGHITQDAEPSVDVIKSMILKSSFNTCDGNNDFYKVLSKGGLIAPNGANEEKDLFKYLIKNWQEPFFRNEMDSNSVALHEKLVEKGLIIKGANPSETDEEENIIYYSDNSIDNIELAYELVNELDLNETIGGGRIVRAYNHRNKKLEDGGNLKSAESFQEYNDFKNNKLKSMDIVCVNCMWEWNLADTEPHDKYVCHRCGFDNTPFYTVFKETMSLEDIAKKHNVDMDYLQNQFEIGSKHEEDEHTKKGTKLAKEVGETIALHHLEEMPDYYERIKDLENKTDNFQNKTDFKLKNGLVEFENYQEPEVEYVKYAVWYPGKNNVAEAYDFAELNEAVNHIKRNGGNGVIRDFEGRKVIKNDDLQKVLKGERRYYEFEDGGDIKEPKSEYEIADFLEEQKEEADAILFSRRTMIAKIMICNAYIEMAEQKIEEADTALIKNVWQQVKYIWETTKEEVDDVIFMYEQGGEAGGCGCTKRMAKGGLAYGNSHDKGGMPMKVKSTGQNIEIEGGEGVINKRSMQMTKRVEFEGEKLTPCEVISKINEMGGGVKFNCDDVKQIIEKDGDF